MVEYTDYTRSVPKIETPTREYADRGSYDGGQW